MTNILAASVVVLCRSLSSDYPDSLCLLTNCRMRCPNGLNLDLTATAMQRPSTFGCPDDVASLIDFHPPLHQQKTFPFRGNGSVRQDTRHQSHQRYPGGGLLCVRLQYHTSRRISPSDRRFTISSRSVGLLFSTNTLALWPTVTVCLNGFIGYTLASGLQCNG